MLREKSQIDDKAAQFAVSLQQLTAENDEKDSKLTALREKHTFLQSEVEQLRRQVNDERLRGVTLEKDKAQSYRDGQRDKEEEMSFENGKLREMIAQLRQEISALKNQIADLSVQLYNREIDL